MSDRETAVAEALAAHHTSTAADCTCGWSGKVTAPPWPAYRAHVAAAVLAALDGAPTPGALADGERAADDVREVSEALYGASLEEILGVPDEALDDVARVVLSLGMRLPNADLAATCASGARSGLTEDERKILREWHDSPSTSAHNMLRRLEHTVGRILAARASAAGETATQGDGALRALADAAEALEGRLGTEGAPTNLYEFRVWLRERASALAADPADTGGHDE